MTDLQKASLGKRIIAAIFDFILLSIIAVGLATTLSSLFGYDEYMNTVEVAYETYEAEYGVSLQMTKQEYEALPEQQQENYKAAMTAINKDEAVVYAYNMLINLMMLILTVSILIAVLVIDFVIPLFFGNGQTLGKKIFGIAVMHAEGIRVSNVQLFIRTLLGKFVFELMIPLSIIFMIFFNSIGILGPLVLLALLIAQLVSLGTSHTNSFLHDVMSGTVAVDFASQRIFKDREELIEYTKAVHAEKAAQKEYN